MNQSNQQMGNNQKTVVSRGLLPVYYSTTSGMSKNFANQFQSKAQEIGFTAPVMNIGDINTQEFLQYQGTIVMILSTYYNGDSPDDGETFLHWIQNLKCESALKKMRFVIMALGNSTFDHFCGHGRRMTEALVSNGAEMLMDLKKCDANVESESAPKQFDPWSEKVLNLLTLKYELKQFPLEALTGGFSVEIKKERIDWEAQLLKKQVNLGKEFSTYLKSHKAEVIHIKELRNDIAQSGRSTLWIRIKKPDGMKLWPGCNVNIYPENIVPAHEQQDNQTISFVPKRANSKIPFPAMTISDLRKLVNLRQKPSNKLIKNAIMLSDKSAQIKDKYRMIIKDNKIEELMCETILKDLEPSFEFYADLGLNLPRAYTLASWNKDDQYFDLCVSTLKSGLTSTYLKSLPKQLRISSFESTFVAPAKPLVMIGNGSGIAPFRSMIQYMAEQPVESRVPLKLYYGIQNESTDYYFRQDFEQYEKDGIVEIKLAQSRKDPNHKQYIQELVEQDKEWLREHLFKNSGQIYICGGKQMEKAVNASIFKAITLQCKVPYKGFTILNKFKADKVIVEEVFG